MANNIYILLIIYIFSSWLLSKSIPKKEKINLMLQIDYKTNSITANLILRQIFFFLRKLTFCDAGDAIN